MNNEQPLSLKQVIDLVLETNDGLCMNDDDEREFLANELYLTIRDEIEEQVLAVNRFIKPTE